MASNLTGPGAQHRRRSTTAVANGDLSKKITADGAGGDPRAEGDDQHDGRPAQRVASRGAAWRARWGTDGKLGGQSQVQGNLGDVKDRTDNVNSWPAT
jgi:hypothetical protein